VVFRLSVMQTAPLIIRPTKGFAALRLGELWNYRELLVFLVWRDILVRYKQTVLGIAWAVIRPVLLTILLTYVFSRLAKISTGGIPYPLFCFCGILAWGYFSEAVTGASGSLIGNQNLISKVYFPRLLIPLAAVGRGVVDFACSFVVLLGLMFWYGQSVRWTILCLPLLLFLALLTALGIGLWFSALSVRFRDASHLLPFSVQIWFWITPVAYGSDLVPQSFRWLHWLNPMTGVVEGFRWSILGAATVSAGPLLASASMTLLVVVAGMFFFRRMERQFADVI